jgi:hypothetical protein
MSLIHNERIKLTATYFNGIAIAIFAIGGLAPVIAGLSATGVGITARTALLVLSCFFVFGTLHYVSRTLLKGLQA